MFRLSLINFSTVLFLTVFRYLIFDEEVFEFFFNIEMNYPSVPLSGESLTVPFSFELLALKSAGISSISL